MKELIQVLIDWINDELAQQRIIVKDISEDLYDGQVLQKLLEKLTEKKLDVPEVTQSEEGQRQKLAVVLKAVDRVSKITLLFLVKSEQDFTIIFCYAIHEHVCWN